MVFRETDAFIRTSSYGKAWLEDTVTPWLAIPGTSTGCSFAPVGREARAAAAARGSIASRTTR